MSEDHALEEMLIAKMCLYFTMLIPFCVMDKYWKNKGIKHGKWHFVRKPNDIRKYNGGSCKVIDKIIDTKSKLPFMDQ